MPATLRAWRAYTYARDTRGLGPLRSLDARTADVLVSISYARRRPHPPWWGGGYRGLNPRPITVHSKARVCTSPGAHMSARARAPRPSAPRPSAARRSRHYNSYYGTYPTSLLPYPLRPFICLSGGRTAQSGHAENTPNAIFSSSLRAILDPVRFSDYGSRRIPLWTFSLPTRSRDTSPPSPSFVFLAVAILVPSSWFSLFRESPDRRYLDLFIFSRSSRGIDRESASRHEIASTKFPTVRSTTPPCQRRGSDGIDFVQGR